MHDIAPTWNPRYGSWTPFWKRAVRCAFSNTFDLVSCLILLTDILVVGVEDVVLGAEELRYAAQAVGKISGLVDAEDVLDVIFSQFCIGK